MNLPQNINLNFKKKLIVIYYGKYFIEMVYLKFLKQKNRFATNAYILILKSFLDELGQY